MLFLRNHVFAQGACLSLRLFDAATLYARVSGNTICSTSLPTLRRTTCSVDGISTSAHRVSLDDNPTKGALFVLMVLVLIHGLGIPLHDKAALRLVVSITNNHAPVVGCLPARGAHGGSEHHWLRLRGS
jgi:hypothetical protein